jgi:protein gp37
MSENSKIEWTDHTFNPWEGCQKVGPGCDNCYAETRNARFAGGVAVNWGPGAPRRLTGASNWNKPIKWNAQAKLQHDAWEGFKAQHPGLTDDQLEAKGFSKPRRTRVFCASLADVFDNAVNPSWRADLFGLILKTPYLDWLLLTKRIRNVQSMLAELAHESDPDLSLLDMMPLPNVWIGATIVNQEEADRDIPKLLQVPAKVRFLSMEPLLGPVDIRHRLGPCVFTEKDQSATGRGIDWVIVGGESGPGARPMHPDWARRLRDQCTAAGVPFLFKQWGEWEPKGAGSSVDVSYVSHTGTVNKHKPIDPIFGNEARVVRVGKKAPGRLLDGRTWDETPAT